jgi:hypothetical protein
MKKFYKEALKNYLLWKLPVALTGLFCVIIVWLAFSTQHYELIGILVLLNILLAIILIVLPPIKLINSVKDLIKSF